MAHPTAASRMLLLTGILLIASNLRAPFTIIGPLLSLIRPDLGLGSTAAGALVALPLLGFALVSPFAAVLARTYGLERTLFGALVCILAGVLLRSAKPTVCLYIGTCLIGMSIAVGNVLLPSLVKRDFAEKIAATTGRYAVVMGAMAALASAVAVPLAQQWGWKRTLASCLLLPLAALAVWWPQLRGPALPAAVGYSVQRTGVWRSALAWQVTLFFGLNATIYYIAVAWLPSILIAAGFAPAQAGSIQGVMQLATAAPGLIFGAIVGRLGDQRLAALVIAVLCGVACGGLLLISRYALLWATMFGFGSGAGIILALAMTGLRTRDSPQAAALSGMAQGVGYLLASMGPTAVAALHDQQGGWSGPLQACTVLTMLMGVAGWLAGRNMRVGEEKPGPTRPHTQSPRT